MFICVTKVNNDPIRQSEEVLFEHFPLTSLNIFSGDLTSLYTSHRFLDKK